MPTSFPSLSYPDAKTGAKRQAHYGATRSAAARPGIRPAARAGFALRRGPDSPCGAGRDSRCCVGLDRPAVPARIALRCRPGSPPAWIRPAAPAQMPCGAPAIASRCRRGSPCGTGFDHPAAPRGTACGTAGGTACGAAVIAFRRSRDRRAARACAVARRRRGRGGDANVCRPPAHRSRLWLARRFLPGSCPVLAGPATQAPLRGSRIPFPARFPTWETSIAGRRAPRESVNAGSGRRRNPLTPFIGEMLLTGKMPIV